VKLPAYPRYKPSGVEWLDDVPEHWDSVALKRRFHIVNGGTPSSSEDTYWEGEIPWFTPEDLGRNETKVIASSRRQITKEGLANCGAKLSPGGSVLVSTRAPIGHVAVMGVDGCCNQGCRILATEGSRVSASFCFYVVIASNEVLKSVGKGTTFLELSGGALGAHWIPLPAPAEQRAIAAFLDRETGRVDQLVAKKRELIERLKEKRTALISRTVTRGLPPAAARAAAFLENPPLKPSGLDWLGDIPAHWEVRKFSRCAFFQEGPGLRNWQFTQGGIRVICVTNITEAGISFANYGKFISEEEYEGTYRHFTVANGDLLLSSSGNSWGKVATFDAVDVAILNTSTIRVNENCSRTVIRSLIGWLLISEGTREQLRLFMTGACQPNFGPSHLAKVWICVPPPTEQAAIAAFLDSETAKLDALIDKVEEAVERLQEYRTALITAAVTGKIDVREAAA
jgi:type I restriction enzyme, S subunit